MRKHKVTAVEQRAIERLEGAESSLYPALRILRALDPIALHDAADWVTSAEGECYGGSPEPDYRLVAYGFPLRDGSGNVRNVDIVTLTIGCGAGEGVMQVHTCDYWNLQESFTREKNAPLAWQLIAERSRGWIDGKGDKF